MFMSGYVEHTRMPELPSEWREMNAYPRDILHSLATDGPASGIELKDRIGGVPGRESKTPLYRSLDQLEHSGLIEAHERDGRENEYALTEGGAGLLDDVRTAWEEMSLTTLEATVNGGNNE